MLSDVQSSVGRKELTGRVQGVLCGIPPWCLVLEKGVKRKA